MTASVIIDIPINQLRPSKRNVRKSQPSAEADQELLAGIRANGVLQNLVVIMSQEPGSYEVVAGKRRLAAARALVKEGHYQDTDKLPCRILECDDSAEEIGLIENMQRVRMHPADEFQAFQKMVTRAGMTPADIAAHLGIPERTVTQRLKLARVAPAIIKAYRAGTISGGEVEAFTLEDDKQRQLEVFEALTSDDRLTARAIREALKGGAMRGSDRLAIFVGPTAYEEAGGSLSQDLFQETTYFNDPELVRTLAMQKLEQAAASLSDEWNWTEITLDHLSPYGSQRITAYDTPETITLREKHKLIEDKLDALAEIEYTDEWTPEDTQLEERLTEEWEKTEAAIDQSRSYKPEEMALAGCVVGVNGYGDLDIDYGLVRKADEKALKALQTGGADQATRADTRTDSTTAADSTEDDSAPLSQALLQDLTTYRANVIKRFLAEDTNTARDLLYYTLCMLTFGTHYYGRPIDITVTETRPAHTLNKPDTGRALAEMAAIREALPLEWLTIEDDGERFEAFSCLSGISKELLMAHCVASALQVTLSDRNSYPETEAAAARMDIPWHRYFTPTAENYLGRISKAQLLALGEQFFSDYAAEGAEKRSKKQLAEDLEGVFAGEDPTMPPDQRAAAIDWIPEGFRPA